MEQKNIVLQEFWDRVNNEIKKHHIQKKQLAERCRFSRKILFGYRHYMCTPYFARLCAELHVSADYLLFGKNKGAE